MTRARRILYHGSGIHAIRLRDTGRYLAGMLTKMDRYPLADQADSLSCQPVLIVGSPRSGTTLLRSMLVAGEQVAIPPESQVMGTAVRRYLSLQCLGWGDLCRLIIALFHSSPQFPIWETDLYPVYHTAINLPEDERSLARVVDEVFMRYAAQELPGASVWGDQSPLNTLHLPWIFHTFPGARYLHLLRDGRDAIASMIEKGRTLEYASERWTTSVEQALMLQDYIGSGQFLEMRYETLVSQPAESLEQICSFVGVQYKARMLDFWRLPTTVEHKYFEHHRGLARPLFTSSIGKWTERLSQRERQYVLSKTSHLLRRLGYV